MNWTKVSIIGQIGLGIFWLFIFFSLGSLFSLIASMLFFSAAIISIYGYYKNKHTTLDEWLKKESKVEQ